MIIEQNDDKITVSLVFSIRWEKPGYVVAEQSGHQGSIEWGPMPFALVEAFIDERRKHLQATLRQVADEMFRTKVWPI